MPLMSGNLIKNLFAGPVTRPYPVAKRRSFPRARAQLLYNPTGCTYCGICANICPANAIQMKEDRESLRINRTYDSFACIYCARCIEFCPNGALKMGVEHLEPTDRKAVMRTAGRA
jgi:formate hydrogenlyase subunit 6/NADH:ubiquinone oxidoreductase subunit I